jgi:hypothetical protein
MKVDGLKFTDALQIERCPKILGNVDVQAIAIGIDEAETWPLGPGSAAPTSALRLCGSAQPAPLESPEPYRESHSIVGLEPGTGSSNTPGRIRLLFANQPSTSSMPRAISEIEHTTTGGKKKTQVRGYAERAESTALVAPWPESPVSKNGWNGKT